MDAVGEILVVDDERLMRARLRRMLEAEGFRVRTANNGEEALEAMLVRKPALVVIDFQMPRLNGIATCEAIRKTDPLLPVLFLTAFDNEANELRARGVGADDFFDKTVSDAVLVAAIRRALARSTATAERSVEARRAMIGRVEIDFDTMTARGGGLDERLTKSEIDFLRLLCSERGRCFSFDQIIEHMHRNGCTGDETSLYSQISRLKRKLGSAGSLIRNERALGYSLS